MTRAHHRAHTPYGPIHPAFTAAQVAVIRDVQKTLRRQPDAYYQSEWCAAPANRVESLEEFTDRTRGMCGVTMCLAGHIAHRAKLAVPDIASVKNSYAEDADFYEENHGCRLSIGPKLTAKGRALGSDSTWMELASRFLGFSWRDEVMENLFTGSPVSDAWPDGLAAEYQAARHRRDEAGMAAVAIKRLDYFLTHRA